MPGKTNLYDSTYQNFETDVLARVRRKTFGDDIGQNSWTTADEYRAWALLLNVSANTSVLEVACGSGGPALYLAEQTRCRVSGVYINAHGVAAANHAAQLRGLSERVAFRAANADEPLPFADTSFDAVLCVDAVNHFPRRAHVLEQWHRVLRPHGCVLFTDPVVVTGLVSADDLAIRASIGWFGFAPPGYNESVLDQVGFDLLEREDRSEQAASIAACWRDARLGERESLIRIEGEQRFEQLQSFFDAVHRLARDRCLSRYAYLARKRDNV